MSLPLPSEESRECVLKAMEASVLQPRFPCRTLYFTFSGGGSCAAPARHLLPLRRGCLTAGFR